MKQSAPLGPGTWIRMMKAYNLLMRHARASLEGRCTLSQFDVLTHLYTEQKGLTPAELSRRLLVTAGNVTGLIDRMERIGWVKRVPDPEDRRISRVVLTPAGRSLAGKLIPQHSSDIEELFSSLKEREILQLRDLLDRLIAGVEQRP